MRYLTVDGYFDGTGIRDAANGGYLEHDEVGISPDLSKRIDVWLEQYWKEFIKGFPDRDKVVELDEEGIRIARRLKKEFPEDKIGYFSDARMVVHCMMRKYMEGFEVVTIVGRKVKTKMGDNLYGVR